MGKLAERLHALGGLRNAIIRGINWRVEPDSLDIEIGDLNEGFSGLDGYPGPAKGRLVCTGVSRLNLQLDPSIQGLKISAVSVEYEGTPSLRLELSFSPEGKLVVESAQVELRSD